MHYGLPVLCKTHLLEVGLTQSQVDRETSSIAHHAGLHVGSIQTSFVHQALQI